MDRAAWQATVHRDAKNQTGLKQLSTLACTSRENMKMQTRFGSQCANKLTLYKYHLKA